jgi:hypothetical protein
MPLESSKRKMRNRLVDQGDGVDFQKLHLRGDGGQAVTLLCLLLAA